MRAPGGTRQRLLRELLRASSAEAAWNLIRSEPRFCDAAQARLLLERFNRAVREGRSPVAAARPLAWAAAAVAAQTGTDYCRAVADRTAGVLAHLDGRPVVARRRLVKAARLLERAGDPIGAGDVHRILIDVQMLTGDYVAARRAARRAASCYARSRGAGARRLGSLALNVGNLHHRRDELPEALEAYARAGRLFKRASEPRLLATVDYNRGNVLATLDRIDQARKCYGRARAVFDAEKLPALVAQADSALAALDLLEGCLDACIVRLEDVKHRQHALADQEGMAHAELDQAEAYLRLNRPADAERAARCAATYFGRRGLDAESAMCAGLLAGAALQRDRPRQAGWLFRRGREIERRRGNRVGAALLEIGLARAEMRSGRPHEAFRIANRAARVARKHRLRSREGRALAVAAEAAFGAERPRAARACAQTALRLARSQRNLRVQLAALMVLARIAEEAGRPEDAFHRLRAAERCVEQLRRGITAEESRLAFALDKSEVYEALVLNRLGLGKPAAVRQALVYAERGKARALAERLSQGPVGLLGSTSVGVRRLLDRLLRIERELALGESRLEGSESGTGLRSAVAARIPALTESRIRILGRLSREDPRGAVLAGATPEDPWRAVSRLADNESVLEYTEAGGYFHLFHIDRRGVDAHPRLAPVARVRDVADLLRFQLGKGVLGDEHARFSRFTEAALRKHLETLHDLLLGPVAEQLEGRDVRIVPHGVLHGLPFHAMERADRALVDRCHISYVPSLTVLGLLAVRRARDWSAPLVLGVPDRHAPLIDSEVRAVRRQLRGSRVFRGSAATSHALRLSEGHPALLHVACHGFYAEESPLGGALRLGDAWFSLPEIYALRGTADLVVLSGCETGRGIVYSGDEWVGLVRGFLQAGARAVVASLWEVQDGSTAKMMGDFYRGLASGASVSEALAQAQRRARREDPTPLRWAPFMVIGNPDLKLPLSRVA